MASHDAEGLLQRAREPGFFPVSGKGTHVSTTYTTGDVAEDLDVGNAELNIVPDRPWSQNILTITEHDAQGRILKTAVPATYVMNPPGFCKFPSGSAFIENTLAGMRRPGNWCVNRRTRKVYLIPRSGNPGDDIVAPALTELVSIEGKIDYDGPSDEPVRGIVFDLIHDTPYCAVVISGRITYNRSGQGECARTIRWREIDAARGGQKPLGDWYDREP